MNPSFSVNRPAVCLLARNGGCLVRTMEGMTSRRMLDYSANAVTEEQVMAANARLNAVEQYDAEQQVGKSPRHCWD